MYVTKSRFFEVREKRLGKLSDATADFQLNCRGGGKGRNPKKSSEAVWKETAVCISHQSRFLI